MAFFRELLRVHLGRWRHPELDRNIALAFKQFGCGTEVSNVGHTRTDEDFVDLGASDIAQGFCVIWVIRATHDGLFDLVHVDFNHIEIFRIFVCLQQLWVGQPSFHRLNTTRDSAWVGIALGNHVFQQHNITLDVFHDRLFMQVHGTTSGAALGRCISQFKGLLCLQIRQTFDLQNTA